mmetsp:Transcript_36505/g.56092  ORF Transcript_36505/g.56092 Transcript_36505/m.56092 type:complete len:128 (-) Transcript_36505:168-551(-)
MKKYTCGSISDKFAFNAPVCTPPTKYSPPTLTPHPPPLFCKSRTAIANNIAAKEGDNCNEQQQQQQQQRRQKGTHKEGTKKGFQQTFGAKKSVPSTYFHGRTRKTRRRAQEGEHHVEGRAGRTGSAN